MASPHNEFDRLLAAPDPWTAQMARDLLADAGIPSLVHGQDVSIGELGASVQLAFTRPDLYVPKNCGARAREVLREAWDETALAAIEFPDEVAPSAMPASIERRWPQILAWSLLGIVIVLDVLVGARCYV